MSYSPTLGRFLERDPEGYTDGMNDYQFEVSNPANRVDPLGTDSSATQPTTGPWKPPPGFQGPRPITGPDVPPEEPPEDVVNPVLVDILPQPIKGDPNHVGIVCKIGCEGKDGPYNGVFDISKEGDDIDAAFPIMQFDKDKRRPMNICRDGVIRVDVRIKGPKPGKIILTPKDGGKPVVLPINQPPATQP